MNKTVDELIENAFKHTLSNLNISNVNTQKFKEQHEQFEKEFNIEFEQTKDKVNKLKKSIHKSC